MTKEAKADLASIHNWMQKVAGRTIADNFVKRMRTQLHSMQDFPHRGNLQSDLSEGLRVIGFEKRASIAFSVYEETKTLGILRILYRGADWQSELGEE